MYIFTQWNQLPLPPRYAECVAALRERYPSLVVEPFISPEGEDPRIESDIRRFTRLAEIDGPALYVDADCTPGTETFTGGSSLAFANVRGGRREIWSIYSPGMGEARAALRYIVSAIPGDRSPAWFVPYVDRVSAVALAGYPDYRYLRHKA